MIITHSQISGARNMLLMSQEQLAVAAGVSARTVNKAEAPPDPKQTEFVSYESILKIKKALEKRNIRFLGTTGITIVEVTEAKAFEGDDGPFIFYDDVLAAAKATDDEIYALYDTAESFALSLGVTDFADLGPLEEISRHATVKLLLTKPEKSELQLPFFKVRQTTQFPFSYEMRIISEKLHATIRMVDGRHFSYYESTSLELASAGKMDFLSAWATSTPFEAMVKPVKKKVSA